MFQIMVVEDDINARRLMQAVIEQNGYEAIRPRPMGRRRLR